LYDGSAHETYDEDGHESVHTSGNFDATKQLPADNRPINNGTAADEPPIDDQQGIVLAQHPLNCLQQIPHPMIMLMSPMYT
jgi:hypothetical protein